MKTVHLTTAQALVKFLDNQYVERDGVETKFVEGVFTIFGHGIVLGLGQALDENPGSLKVFQGRNEQGMAHTAAAFAKQNNRKKIIACSSSIGPGAANMVTAAACATVNNVPLLLLPGDTYATRQPDPVLQQIEQPTSLGITTNDAFRAVTKYFDRIVRPEQLMNAMVNAMRVLTDPAETGAVCIALSQDVEGEAYDYPEYFFNKRVHRIARTLPSDEEMKDAVELIKKAKKPLVICGGGVRYSEAGEALVKFCKTFNIPYAETQAGKSATKSSCEYNLGGIGVTGNLAANTIARSADLVISVGSRLTDFTTGSKAQFSDKASFININVSRFHAYKLDALSVVGDAKATLSKLTSLLKSAGYKSKYTTEIAKARESWAKEMEKLAAYSYGKGFKPLIPAGNKGSIEEFVKLYGTEVTQVSAICAIRENIPANAIITGASGSLPGDLQRMWTTDTKDAYHMEYGYSCMGYEVSSALGCKLANPEREVYAMLGDGSFLMLHSELITSLQEGRKINVLLFDNCGFGCINNLQMSNGVGNLATEFRYRDEKGGLNGSLIPIDYAKVAAGYGCKTYTVHTLEELKRALRGARRSKVSTLIDIKALPKTMTDGYDSWWNVGAAEVTSSKAGQEAYKKVIDNREKARKY
ncbi:MAG: 3D-(3,5/4)-trihydroxycyclohexane-1,2-dione acylhydrolase (decyclizing) [Lachnospiraceae bacterium]|nr:3D-(3,5/4)-trihydroxycyclohexane-1,2-dione acylhydrolase (decyclizing) [Lachnospiraceae bacterium]